MESKEKIVNFDLYCVSCNNKDCKDDEEPCNECLHSPSNMDSHKPVGYEHKD